MHIFQNILEHEHLLPNYVIYSYEHILLNFIFIIYNIKFEYLTTTNI